MELHQKGQYDRAVVVAKKALERAEGRAYGSEKYYQGRVLVAVSTSLSNLARIYKAQGQHAQAEELYLRAVAVGENAVTNMKASAFAHYSDVTAAMDNLAGIYSSHGHYDMAERYYSRILTRRGSGSSPRELRDMATSLNNLASSCCMGRVFALARVVRARLPGRSVT